MSLYYWALKAIRASRNIKMGIISIASRIELSRSKEPLALAKRVAEALTGFGLYDGQKEIMFKTHVGLLVPLAKRSPEACGVLLEGLANYASSHGLKQLMLARSFGLGTLENKLQTELSVQALKAIPHLVHQAPEIALKLAYKDGAFRGRIHSQRYDILFPHIARLAADKPELAMSFALNIVSVADTPKRLEAVADHILALAPRVEPQRVNIEALLEHPQIGNVSGLKERVTDVGLGLVAAVYRKDTFSGIHLAKALLDHNPGHARVTGMAADVLGLHKQELGQIWPYHEGIYYMAQTLMQRQGIDVTSQGAFVCRDFAVLASANPATHENIVVFLGDKKGPVAMTHTGDFVRSWPADKPACTGDFKYSPAVEDAAHIDARITDLISSIASDNLPDFATAVKIKQATPKVA